MFSNDQSSAKLPIKFTVEWEIEEDYQEQLKEEHWYYDEDEEDEEEIYWEFKDRQEHGVFDHMFH